MEYECQVPVGGYEVITIEPNLVDPLRRVGLLRDAGKLHVLGDGPPTGAVLEKVFGKLRMLQPRSERTRRFDLFKASSSAFLEFAQTPDTPDGIKDFADRYGLLCPDVGTGPHQTGRSIPSWSRCIRELRQIVELWERSTQKRDFSKIVQVMQKKLVLPDDYDSVSGVPVELLLKEDQLNASVSLCIRSRSLIHALWAQFLLAIDGNLNLRACVQCRKWFTLEAGRGRSDKEYCSNACRMRAYRKRKRQRPRRDDGT